MVSTTTPSVLTNNNSSTSNSNNHHHPYDHQNQNHHQQQRRTIPYATSMVEAPMFYMIFSNLCCYNIFHSIFSILYKIRWMMSYPLRTAIVPHWIPYQIQQHQTNDTKMKQSKSIYKWCYQLYSTIVSNMIDYTIGDVILILPIIIWMIEGYYVSFIQPSITNSGYIASYMIFVTFLSANKSNSLFTFLFGIPFERMITYHKICSICSIITSIFHIYVSYSTSGYNKIFIYLASDSITITGTCIISCMIALVTLSFYSVILRQYAFQLWLYSHILFAIGTIITLFMHNVYTAIFVTMWWILDIIVRYGIMTHCQYPISSNRIQIRRIATPTTTTTSGTPTTNNDYEPAVEISFPKPLGFVYNPGQFVQIAIPSISMLEYHPISISSSPHESTVTMHVRQRGDWTSSLVALSEQQEQRNTSTKKVSILMEGPYGSLSLDLNDISRYQIVLLVCGGIGVTPCQSIGKSLIYDHLYHDRPIKYMKMVWAVRDMNIVHDIPPLGGKDILCHTPNVYVDIYCTRTNDNDVEISNSALSTDLPSATTSIQCGKRPDLDILFTEMKQIANQHGEHSIAVIGCGPTSLMEDLRVTCRKYSPSMISTASDCCSCSNNNDQNGVFFDLHTEYFEF